MSAVDFVLKSLEIMVGGELFVPKIPSMKITDLAKAICSDCKTEIVGIRPGEKLHEVMVPKDDAYNTVEFENYYVIKSSFRNFERRFNGGEIVPECFEYNSGTNQWLLTIEEMREMIKCFGYSAYYERFLYPRVPASVLQEKIPHQPGTKAAYEQIILLPIFPGMSKSDVDRVISVVKKAIGQIVESLE